MLGRVLEPKKARLAQPYLQAIRGRRFQVHCRRKRLFYGADIGELTSACRRDSGPNRLMAAATQRIMSNDCHGAHRRSTREISLYLCQQLALQYRLTHRATHSALPRGSISPHIYWRKHTRSEIRRTIQGATANVRRWNSAVCHCDIFHNYSQRLHVCVNFVLKSVRNVINWDEKYTFFRYKTRRC